MGSIRKIIFTLLSGMVCLLAHAQDPQFSQFYANPLYTNPAFAGTTSGIRFTTLARNQYTALQNNYKTASASIDANISSLNGGLGLMAMYDVAGDGFLTNNVISGIYSYHTQLSRKLSFRAGIQASVVQKTYDFNRFHFGDQIDDRLGFVNPTAERKNLDQRIFPNFSTGMLFYTDQIYGGFAVHNIIEPNQSFYFASSSKDEFKLPRRYTFHAGGIIYLTNQRREEERIYISPNVLYMQQRNFNQLNLGFYLKRNNLIIGGWLRQTSQNTDAVIGLIGFKFNRLRIGYSFDATVSGARSATTGSHEISLAAELRSPRKQAGKRVPKAMRCPEF
jgi:type IX secretion system PorP/SprF family membrane protein